ncbi:MAG TPA: transcription-repair coupling factor [Dehalococcoidia bacterium]|nr:transcription-repair coupling factor [Dehalococcoidia bacterium]MDP6272896.1 transcription-repair coupling factor [Dehalococcoidia bacterium]MDP7161789.1 transcription-repair coupling factor [Dehalococcoidia bacterium]MDP7212563.1 transcription-repair coupling factor [Dehalococcoidia bacterium]MDP7514328.1 transcription-repair coupling factor [Dehalococcoidia bacterium]
MTLSALLPLLSESERFQELIHRLRAPRSREVLIAPDAPTPYAVGALWRSLGAPIVVVTPQPESARRLTAQLYTWLGDNAPIYQFAENETLPYERLSPDRGATHQRLRSLAALEDRLAPRPPLVVVSALALSQKTLDPKTFRAGSYRVEVGDVSAPAKLVETWIEIGYEVEPTVEVPGTISRRGGILDVFPVSSDVPYRIEFFGDEVDSIRVFDPETQRSVEPAAVVTIVPAEETLPLRSDGGRVEDLITGLDFSGRAARVEDRITEELGRVLRGEMREELSYYSGLFNHGSLFDFMPPGALLVTLRPSAIEEASRSANRRMEQLRITKATRGEIPGGFPLPHLEWGLMADAMNGRERSVAISPFGVDDDRLPGSAERLPFEISSFSGGEAEKALEEIERRRAAGYRVVVLTQHAERLAEMAHEKGLPHAVAKGPLKEPEPGTAIFVQGQLREGFVMAPIGESPLTLLTDREVFGVSKERRRIRRRPIRRGVKLSDLRPGVYVVHVEHGVGRFIGAEAAKDEGREYLLVEYADDDRLYVPTEHVDRLSLYRSAADVPPRLTRLGTQEWTRTKARVRRATEQIAADLIALYASREVVPGLQANRDTPWQDRLEASFPFEETSDQLSAIADVKTDLEAPRPMDRLICGDVGYGKTEVALRAAFKVVESGRQVAMLVPTTILAQQHYQTFAERLSAFPVRVDVLSRFRTNEEQRDIAAGVRSGDIDICIGTHRMLQRDISFKNLGMVVIDEEQRFGVIHKERLKQFRSEVDVLAMSATPIPRTLHLSLSGVRDMSTMETPPDERLSIKTYVSEESNDLIREAVLREMDRGGQVFFVHNRVKNIEHTAYKLQQMVPEARIVIGHGQMREDNLEKVMTAFAAHEFDVLVCTTIIESGLDLPNVNTLIVDRADMFGLSQLYQLRGRVGRGTNRAYSYFLVPKGKQLTEQADQRLNTILAATELGAGFRIAMRDLEIRGAGNILGDQQSGHIAAIGFDLYNSLLSRAVQAARALREGKDAPDEVPGFSTTRIDLGVEALVPDYYVEDLVERLDIYQRLAAIRSLDQVEELEEELEDRFGRIPGPTAVLLYTARVRVLSETCGVNTVVATDKRITLSLDEATGGARRVLQKVLKRGVTVGHMQIRLDIDREDPGWREELIWTLEELGRFRQQFLSVLADAGAAAGGT